MRKVLFILGELSDLDVEWLISQGVKLTIPKGTVLIREGTEVEAMFIVLAGEFSVSVGTATRKEIARLGVGEIIGEMSFIEARPPIASVEALRDSVVLSVRRDHLQAKMREDLGFAARFYRALAVFLSDRLRSTVGRFGYGKADISEETEDVEGELDENVLDTVHLAGVRFDRMLKKLMGA